MFERPRAFLSQRVQRATVDASTGLMLAIATLGLSACTRKEPPKRHSHAVAAVVTASTASTQALALPSANATRATPTADSIVAMPSAAPTVVVPRPYVVARPEHLFFTLTEICLRTAKTTLRCWGHGSGQQSAKITTYRDTVALSDNYYERSDGSWGYRQGDVPPHVDLPTAVNDMNLEVGRERPQMRMAGLEGATSIGGEHHACALLDGKVLCWGLNDERQLGYDTNAGCYYMNRNLSCSRVPTEVRGLGNVVELAVGYAHTCARQSNGGVLCWGAIVNAAPPEGCGSEDGVCRAKPPVPIRGLEDARQIASADYTMCGVLPSGTVACLGARFPISKDEKWRERRTALPVPGFDNAVRVALSQEQLCAITREGGVRCKRACYPRDDCAAADLPDLSEVTELGVTNECACALRRDGSLWCWGARYCMGLPGSGQVVTPVHLLVGKDSIREAEAPQDAGIILDGGAFPSTAP